MAEVVRRRVDVSAATFLRLLGIAILVWVWIRMWRWVLIFLVAVFLAVALDPIVAWLEKRGLRRSFGGPLIVLALALIVGGFFYFSGSALQEQAGMLGQRISETRQKLGEWIPEELKKLLSNSGVPALGTGQQESGGSGESGAGGLAMRAARALVSGILSMLVALVLTAYLLIDGRRTYEWFLAFAPPAKRPRVEQTAIEARRAIKGYIRGSVATSVLTAIATFTVLALLKVPAALLLAVLAGILNFIPVVGLVLSMVPAFLLALTVSPAVAISVVAFFLGYNTLENYYIQPKVYGHEMRLSGLAVLAAFAAGAELGGVIGALIALPIAAMYPPFESLWLEDRLHQAVKDHRRIERTTEH